MIQNKWALRCIILLLLAGCILPCHAQRDPGEFVVPRTNSQATLEQTIASTIIQIKYNRPNKRGREIFGDLVPYGHIWRTGSDEATELYFSTPVTLAGTLVDSGRYELFTIPGPDTWEIILQQSLHQWGSYLYQADNDVARFSVVPVNTDRIKETFTMSIDQVGADHGTLQISWDRTVVPIEIKIDLKETVIPQLEEVLSQEGRRPYFQAAMFYYENQLDITRASELIALALEKNPDHIGMLYRQGVILKRKGDIKDAIHAADRSLAGAQEADPELKAEYIRLNTALLNELNALDH
ncbi:MAG: DUF2911 domain-containing protein [Saprospiraceae bacterium]|nr:DUF2911 domain-containing protein [Saprospiraceae bacterium]